MYVSPVTGYIQEVAADDCEIIWCKNKNAKIRIVEVPHEFGKGGSTKTKCSGDPQVDYANQQPLSPVSMWRCGWRNSCCWSRRGSGDTLRGTCYCCPISSDFPIMGNVELEMQVGVVCVNVSAKTR